MIAVNLYPYQLLYLQECLKDTGLKIESENIKDNGEQKTVLLDTESAENVIYCLLFNNMTAAHSC